ncbi:MAG: hypothetical protein HZB51_34110 [Chloroflexi bacterium]|nr:hypothetical protein [Chloroflexota bacterium]
MADNLLIIDGAGTTKSIRTTDNAGVHTPHNIIDTITAGASADIGATSDAAVVTDANGTLSGKLRGLVKWAFERMPASLGQKARAASLGVALASDQMLADDAAFTPATSQVLPVGAAYQATPDLVDDNDIGAFRMTIRRALLNAPDYWLLSLSSGTPVPAGSDITNQGSGALVAGDFQIRDTNVHGFRIPLLGWRDVTITFANAEAFNQNLSVSIYAGAGTGINTYLMGVTYPASQVYNFSIGHGGAVGQGGNAGGATVGSGVFYNVPAIAGFGYIVLYFSAAVAPAQGNFSLAVYRRTG